MSKQPSLFNFFKKIPSPNVRDKNSEPNKASDNFIASKKSDQSKKNGKEITLVFFHFFY